eukprot:1158605-Pelagomonas_calceolata.AAC.16
MPLGCPWAGQEAKGGSCPHHSSLSPALHLECMCEPNFGVHVQATFSNAAGYKEKKLFTNISKLSEKAREVGDKGLGAGSHSRVEDKAVARSRGSKAEMPVRFGCCLCWLRRLKGMRPACVHDSACPDHAMQKHMRDTCTRLRACVCLCTGMKLPAEAKRAMLCK